MGSLCLVYTLFTIVSTRVLHRSHGLSLPRLYSLYHCKYQNTSSQSWALCLVCTLFTIVSTRVLHRSHGLSLPCLYSLYHCEYQSTSSQSWALSALSILYPCKYLSTSLYCTCKDCFSSPSVCCSTIVVIVNGL